MVEEARVSARLPDFPWDALTSYAATARAHPDGIVDLSIGTPVDPTPQVVQDALRAAADSPGYPLTIGLGRPGRPAWTGCPAGAGVTGLGLDAVLPVIGSKELIASLPLHLGIGPGDLVVHPELAYPTYEVGARLAGARSLATDSLTAVGPERPRLLWVNSPSNPTGRVLPVAHLRKMVGLGPRARHRPGLRRVLPRVRLGGRAGQPAAPRRLRRRTRRGCSPCTRSPSAPTWRATAARSWPVTPPWSASCSRSARTSG